MSNKHVLKGMSQLVNTQNVKSGLNYEEIERKMLLNGVIEQPKDPTESFKSALNDLAKNLQLNFETPKTSAPTPKIQANPTPSYSQMPPVRTPEARNRTPETYTTSTHMRPKPSTPRMSTVEAASSDDESASSGGDDTRHNDTPHNDTRHNDTRHNDTPQQRTPQRVSPPSQFSPPKTEFERRTREQEHHAQIRSMIRDSGDDPDDDTFTVEKEKMEDAKTSMLVEIDSLWSDLEEENVNLERIPRPTQNSSYETVENVLKTLRMKLDRARYCSLADDVVLAGAGIIEDIFDGKRVFFNRYSPDMSGWSKSVQMKLRRMKHDTSSIVGNVMSENNIGPGTRIALELVPNAFMHARSKRAQFGKETIYSDAELQRSISNLRNIEEN